MTSGDSKTESVVEISHAVVEDGKIRARVARWGVWVNAQIDRHSLRAGLSLEPWGELLIDIPVEGIRAGVAITPEEAAALLQASLATVLPTCRVFSKEAANDFLEVKEDF